MAPYTAFSKNNQLSTGPPWNPRVFHLHVNNHCTSQEVDTCALVKVVPMKSWCHIWKYIKSTLHICINGENRTSKSGKIWAGKKILVWNMWNYNRLSGQLPVWYLHWLPFWVYWQFSPLLFRDRVREWKIQNRLFYFFQYLL